MSDVGKIVTIVSHNIKMTTLNRERIDKSCQAKVPKSQKFLFIRLFYQKPNPENMDFRSI